MIDKQPDPPNPFANVGRPAFVKGGTQAKKMWAIVTTVGFAIFWFSGLFLAAEVFGPRDLTIWPAILTPVGLVIGLIGRVLMAREGA
ncbi:hypothetical protein [Rhodophyticola sp.]|jgi:hypothetical protein|uniref:hypothetical protein n=1 Tax=Rhodophyticola sp. TaxID=2680032 RepID=UPI003D264E35